MAVRRFLSALFAAAIALTGVALVATVAPANAAESISRSSWQMFISPTPYGSLGFTMPSHGDISGYQFAQVPVAADAGWQPAPDGDIIGFGGDNASRLRSDGCLSSVDYTYFQTTVHVPAGGVVDTFTLAFDGIDDGARISVYNSAYPTGLVVPGSYVVLSQSSTNDLASYMREGDNRVVITQIDDCANGNHLSKAAVVLNGVVTPPTVPLTITAQDKTKVYGTADPAFTYTTVGLQGTDTVTTAPTCTAAVPHANVGSYAITCTGASAGPGYTIDYVPGVLSVTKAPLVIKAADKAKNVGAADPPFTYSTTGLLGTDALTTAPTCTVTAAHSAAGNYPIICSGAVAGNYAISYQDATLTVGVADTDGDGVPDSSDNCVTVPNTNQLNTDGDALGNACDPDDDNDGLLDVEEAVIGTNPLVKDTDADATGDKTDNCPTTSNRDQMDVDGNGVGDACEPGAVDVCSALTTPRGYHLIVGTSGANKLTGTAGNDIIYGLGGADEISGLGGDDILCGGGGADTLIGGVGNDVLKGNDGGDILQGGDGRDFLYGGGGGDNLAGGNGDDDLYGGDGGDALNGGPGFDRGIDSVGGNTRTSIESSSPAAA